MKKNTSGTLAPGEKKVKNNSTGSLHKSIKFRYTMKEGIKLILFNISL